MASPRCVGLVFALELLTASALLVDAQGQAAQQPSGKLPVPDAAAQQKAVELIREVYKEDYDKARTPAEKVALAEKMVRQAGQSNTDAAGRYVLLRTARDVAVQAPLVPTLCVGTVARTLCVLPAYRATQSVDTGAFPLGPA